MGNKGKRYELSMKKAINEATHAHVKAHRPDYSGSSKGEVADIMVVWQAERYEAQRPSGHPERHVAYGELKKRTADSGKRSIVMEGRENESGLDELRGLVNESPHWTETVLAVKFDHRELIVLDARELYMHLTEGPFPEAKMDQDPSAETDDWSSVEEHPHEWFGARLTPSDNISMRKPSLDWWPSSTSGVPDHITFLHEIGVENYDIEKEHRP